MAKQIKLTKADEEIMRKLTQTVEANLPYHLARYRPSMIQEFEYLVKEGFYTTVAEAIAEDLFFSNEMYSKSGEQNAAFPIITSERKAS